MNTRRLSTLVASAALVLGALVAAPSPGLAADVSCKRGNHSASEAATSWVGGDVGRVSWRTEAAVSWRDLCSSGRLRVAVLFDADEVAAIGGQLIVDSVTYRLTRDAGPIVSTLPDTCCSDDWAITYLDRDGISMGSKVEVYSVKITTHLRYDGVDYAPRVLKITRLHDHGAGD